MSWKCSNYFLKTIELPEVPENPCLPSPCGLYSECRERNKQAVCLCIQGYIGAPPNCRPECVENSECLTTQACLNMKCKDPCPGLCGINALCSVNNHRANCKCQSQYSGDPYSQCSPIPSETIPSLNNLFLQMFNYFISL